MFYVYLLQSTKDQGYYIGKTKDLRRRLSDHNSGQSISTKKRIPYRLGYYEDFIDKIDAGKREVYLKSGYGRR